MASYFLGFGATQLDATYYGQELVLEKSISDIDKMERIAKEQNFEILSFKNEKATVGKFRANMDTLSDVIEPGATLWFYFSGYGSRVLNFAQKPLNTYCFADGQIAHFELLNWIAGFRKDVNVIVMLDCSHFPQTGGKTLPLSITEQIADDGEVCASIYINLPRKMRGGQNIIFALACQKDELAHEGVFTEAIAEAYLENKDANLADFWDNVEKHSEAEQHPRLVFRPKNGFGSRLKKRIFYTE